MAHFSASWRDVGAVTGRLRAAHRAYGIALANRHNFALEWRAAGVKHGGCRQECRGLRSYLVGAA